MRADRGQGPRPPAFGETDGDRGQVHRIGDGQRRHRLKEGVAAGEGEHDPAWGEDGDGAGEGAQGVGEGAGFALQVFGSEPRHEVDQEPVGPLVAAGAAQPGDHRLRLTPGHDQVLGHQHRLPLTRTCRTRQQVEAVGRQPQLARLEVGIERLSCDGTILRLFRELEDAANDGVLGLTDSIADRIDALGFVLALPGEALLLVHDLQVMRGDAVCFKVIGPKVPPATVAP